MPVAPYGSWRSAIDIDAVIAAGVYLASPWIDGDDVYWLEGRPAEGGRRTLLRRGADGVVRELTPAPFNVRTRVHEYGGGDYTVASGVIVASSFPDGRLVRLDPDGLAPPVPLTPDGPWRYADLRLDLGRRRIVCVREDHSASSLRPVNELVDVPLDGPPSSGRVLVTGPDFVAAPRLSPDGAHMAWLAWNDPDMPWDRTALMTADVAPDGTLTSTRAVVDAPDESVVQPEWSPDGSLVWVSDRPGWWNLYRDGAPIAPMDAECADPAWVFDRSTYGFTADGGVLLAARADGRDGLYRIGGNGAVDDVPLGFTELEALRVVGDLAVVLAGGPRDPWVLLRLDATTGAPAGVLAAGSRLAVDPELLPVPEPIAFPTAGGATARALFYAPANPALQGPVGECPPLLVRSHGGPTSNASGSLSMETAFWTSRGVAVVDVDYRGSTGYGRPYREALNGQWGIADVDDCVAAATFLADRGSVDRTRMAITGGSAGGYTTLACLTFRPGVFAAGISSYGIGDLEVLQGDGHKFEARYADRLVAPWPDGRAVYHERSPVHHLDRMRAPMLIFQGADDRIVPPSQAEAMVVALAARGIPHAAMTFEGEGHGFRRAETKRALMAAELSFLGQVLGFAPADDIEPLEISGLSAPGDRLPASTTRPGVL